MLLWIGILRILATSMIFCFHFLGQYNIDNSGIDIAGISLFCFISGYLIYPVKNVGTKWIINKYLHIMIPYWLVITLVIIANIFVKYKVKETHELLIIFFSGGLFVNDPLYVISWYITFILCLYAMTAICNIHTNVVISTFLFFTSIAFYLIIIKRPYIYIISYIAGYFLKYLQLRFPPRSIDKFNHHRPSSQLKKATIFLQNRCYSFFLIHGGIVLMFVKIFHANFATCLVYSLLLTAILSHWHYKISRKIVINLTFSPK